MLVTLLVMLMMSGMLLLMMMVLMVLAMLKNRWAWRFPSLSRGRQADVAWKIDIVRARPRSALPLKNSHAR